MKDASCCCCWERASLKLGCFMSQLVFVYVCVCVCVSVFACRALSSYLVHWFISLFENILRACLCLRKCLNHEYVCVSE